MYAVDFDRFIGGVEFEGSYSGGTRYGITQSALTNGAYLTMFGTPTKAATMSVSAVMASDYPQGSSFADVTATGVATLSVSPASPEVYAFSCQEAGSSYSHSKLYELLPQTGSVSDDRVHSASLGISDSGFEFHLELGQSVLFPGYFETTKTPCFSHTNQDGTTDWRGFEPDKVVISREFVSHATNMTVTFEVFDTATGSSSPITLTASQLSGYLQTSGALSGSYVFGPSAWGNKWLRNVRIDFDKFSQVAFKGTCNNEGSGKNKKMYYTAPSSINDGAYVGVYGTPTQPGTINMKATFASNFGDATDKTMNDTSTITNRGANLEIEDVSPAVRARGFYRDASSTKFQQANPLEAPLGMSTSGIMFELGTSNSSSVMPGSFSTTDLPVNWFSEEGVLRGFKTQGVILSKKLLQVASISKLTIRWCTYDGTSIVSHSKTIPGATDPNLSTFLNARKNAAGDVVLHQSDWDNGYFLGIDFSYDFFEGGNYVGSGAYVAYYGEGSEVRTVSATATHKSDYGTGATNSSSSTGSLQITTIDPELTVSSAWSIDATVYAPEEEPGYPYAQTGWKNKVPYRWGEDAAHEKAWFLYTLENDTISSAANQELLLSVEEATGGVSPRGFVATQLQIDGFRNVGGVWYQGNSRIDHIDLYNSSQTVLGGYVNGAIDDATPSTRISMAQLASHISGGTLRLDLSSVTGAGFGQVKWIRIHFDLLGQNSTCTARLYGHVFTHGARSDSFSKYTRTTAKFYPRTLKYGTGTDRSALYDMPIGEFQFNAAAYAYRSANACLGALSSAAQSDTVIEVSHGNSHVGYRFAAWNSTYARSDKNEIAFSLDSVNNMTSGQVNVRGFKTEVVDIDKGLIQFGRKPDGTSSFQEARFVFLDKNDGSSKTVVVGKSAISGYWRASSPSFSPAFSTSGALSGTLVWGGPGSYHFDLASQSAFSAYQDCFLKSVTLVYDDDYGAAPYYCANHEVRAQFDGKAAWYDIVNDDPLSASVAGKETAPQDASKPWSVFAVHNASDSAALHVLKPYLGIETHTSFGSISESTQSWHNENMDGNQTCIAVPYDKDFRLWAKIYNASDVSTLEKSDATINLLMRRESGIYQPDGSTVSAWTGFHTYQMTVRSELMGKFGEPGEIWLYGVKDADTSSPSTPAITLVPNLQAVTNASGNPVLTEDGTPKQRVVSFRIKTALCIL